MCQRCIAAALAHLFKLGALDAVVSGEELGEAALYDVIGELLRACWSSAHDGGMAHSVLQFGTGTEDDAAHLDVLARDMIILAFVLTGEGKAEGAYVVYLHTVAIE